MTDIWLKECQKNMKNNNSQKEKKSIEYQSNVVLNRFKSHENSSVFRKSIFLESNEYFLGFNRQENKPKRRMDSCNLNPIHSFLVLSVPSLIEWVSGGHYVYNPTLKRFFLFHNPSLSFLSLFSFSLLLSTCPLSLS